MGHFDPARTDPGPAHLAMKEVGDEFVPENG